MIIGVLKESEGENRVAIMPEHIASLLSLGFEKVLIESDAGMASFKSNSDYEQAGAEVTSRSNVIETADLLVSIGPIPSTSVPSGKSYVTMLNPLSNKDMVESFVDQKSTVFSMDMVPRTTKAQSMDVLSSMATSAGYKAVILAAQHLSKFFPMFMTAAGTIPPAKVLILGAGVAGLQAIATARRLGGVVEAFDVRSAVKEEVMSLGAKFVEVEGASDSSDAGGYAVQQSEEFLNRQKALIQDHAAKSDVIVCTAQIPGRQAPLLVEEETVKAMKPGSVIVDLAASTGGNCACTENGEVIYRHGVCIIGNSNLPSGIPEDSSKMYGKNLINFFKELIQDGQLNLDFENEIIAHTCVTHNGEVISPRIKNIMANAV